MRKFKFWVSPLVNRLPEHYCKLFFSKLIFNLKLSIDRGEFVKNVIKYERIHLQSGYI